MTALADIAPDVIATSTRFCRSLREAGVVTTASAAIEAARVLDLVDLTDRDEVRTGLRAVLASRPEDYEVFDKLFARFWDVGVVDAPRSTRVSARPGIPAPVLRPKRPPSLARWTTASSAADDETISTRRASTDARLAAKDFSTLTPEDLEDIARLAARIARRLAARPSRRWHAAARGSRVHLRQMMRRSVRTGGELVELAFRERRPRKTKLVVLCDVSGSMDLYSGFLVRFLYTLQNCFAKVETFVFSTRLTRVTDQLRRTPYLDVMRRLQAAESDWSGGTRIGDSFTSFLHGWPTLIDGRTIVVIMSDGWDAGDPDVLTAALAAIHRRAGRVVWLNPLLGSPAYRPETRGMVAALPHVDVFAPVHNLDSLRALARHLVL